MKKFLFRFISVSLFVLIAFCSVTSYATQLGRRNDCTSVIENYWKKVNDKDWDGWILSIAPSTRKNAIELIEKEENFEQSIGILSVEHAEILSIELIDEPFSMWEYYPELSGYFYKQNQLKVFCVKVNLKLKEENMFKNGINSLNMVLVFENNEWFIAEMFGEDIDNILKDTPAPGSLYGFASLPACKAEPSSNNVKDELGTIHKNVPFDDYMLNVVYHEISASYPVQATYANIIAIKTLSWCFYRKQPYIAYGYHISYGMVAYTSTLSATNSEINTLNQRIASMKNKCMITGSSVGQKLFFADYDGYQVPSDGGYHSGILNQIQSKRLANGEVDGTHYTWKNILHYFYDYSSHSSSSSVGVVRFLTEGSHTLSSFNVSNSNNIYHWKTCSNCSTIDSYLPHNWTSSSNQYICSDCGRVSNISPY